VDEFVLLCPSGTFWFFFELYNLPSALLRDADLSKAKVHLDTKPNGGDDIMIGIPPNHIQLQVTNGQHHLYTYCKYLIDHWDLIENKRPPLDPPPTGCLFAEALRKSAVEILVQDKACWFINVKYICEWLLIQPQNHMLTGHQLNLKLKNHRRWWVGSWQMLIQ